MSMTGWPGGLERSKLKNGGIEKKRNVVTGALSERRNLSQVRVKLCMGAKAARACVKLMAIRAAIQGQFLAIRGHFRQFVDKEG